MHTDIHLLPFCISYCVCHSGLRQSNVNVAEGQKRARILTSEAYMAEQINQARGRPPVLQYSTAGIII